MSPAPAVGSSVRSFVYNRRTSFVRPSKNPLITSHSTLFDDQAVLCTLIFPLLYIKAARLPRGRDTVRACIGKGVVIVYTQRFSSFLSYPFFGYAPPPPNRAEQESSSIGVFMLFLVSFGKPPFSLFRYI